MIVFEADAELLAADFLYVFFINKKETFRY